MHPYRRNAIVDGIRRDLVMEFKGGKVVVKGYGVVSGERVQYVGDTPNYDEFTSFELGVANYVELLVERGYEDAGEEWERVSGSEAGRTSGFAWRKIDKYLESTGYRIKVLQKHTKYFATGLIMEKRCSLDEGASNVYNKLKLLGKGKGELVRDYKELLVRSVEKSGGFDPDSTDDYFIENEELLHCKRVDRPILFTKLGLDSYIRHLSDRIEYKK